MGDQAPRVINYKVQLPAIATAGNSGSVSIKVLEAGTITGVSYCPTAVITGAATNNRTFNVINKGQDGSGSTNAASLNFANGTNAAAYDEKAITLNATPANLVVAAGDVLQVQSLAVGTGITDPGGEIEVSVLRSA